MSFTKASQHLNCSKAYVSNEINALERYVGTPLFYRNTRMVRLTLVGESLFEHAILIVREFQEIKNTITSLQNKAEGLLRITSPSAYADCILAPNLHRFLQNYPKITLEMNFTGELLNLVDQKIDLAIRLTHEPPQDKIAKRVGDYQMIVCASPVYLEANRRLNKPSQLINYECLIYTTEKNCRRWPFLQQEKPITIEVKSKLAGNSSQLLLRAAVEGLGVARLPDYVVRNSILEKKLTPILTHFYPPPTPIYAIYSQSRVIPPKIHALVNFLQQTHHAHQDCEK